ncbi:chromosomal replication initiator protein DnaA [Sphingobacteriales bacterium UPWRP_1]|nr:chromosomal replication initiation protein DnaA [Sphingobacteriales bacterium TSM_CSM]PSJ76357.1 chromosomal replication initiator protein DnaA [Sphingobacteriales bacterium UPWRP_1]
MKTLTAIWENCLTVIKELVSNEQSYTTWFKPIKPVKLENNVLTIEVPSQFFYEWLEEHYADKLTLAIRREVGTNARFEYQIPVDKGSALNGKSAITHIPAGNGKYNNGDYKNSFIGNPVAIPGIKEVSFESCLNPNHTFANFIEGDCNLLARSAGIAIAKKPGLAYNPMVIYGGSGLGKTHLAHAIGNEIKMLHPEKRVLFVTSEAYISQFIEALKNGNAASFSSFYQTIDVLIIDDIQFFSNKDKTQEHFFHTFNHLHQSGKQLVLTSDRPPKDLTDMDERLLSRFKWGLSVELQIPDFETRIAILERKAQAEDIELPREVSEYVAHHINTSIRIMEGALNSLVAQSKLVNRAIDLNMARQTVRSLVNHVAPEITVGFITKMVGEHYRVTLNDIKGKSRKREIVIARHVSMFLCRKITGKSLTEIGRDFNRDHTTVMHGCTAVTDQMDQMLQFKEEVSEIEKKIRMSE